MLQRSGETEREREIVVLHTMGLRTSDGYSITFYLLITLPLAPSTQCTHGSARLVGGRIEQEGRVEVCINGVWGSVCRAQLKISDVYVLCSQLGYHGPSEEYMRFTDNLSPL